MLAELRILNLAVIPEAELVLSPGLNVITGETGAGKTILAHAISLLMGARADNRMIRPGADEASVEAVFHVIPGLFGDLAGEFDIPEGEEVIIRRRVSRDGRSRAYLDGRATTLAVLGQVVGRLLAFSAQHEQRQLMMASRQLDILDRFAGRELLDLRQEFTLMFDRRSELSAQLQGLNQDWEAQARESQLLEFQAEEIEAAALETGEEEALTAEHRRLLGAEELRGAAGALGELLSTGDGSQTVIDGMAAALARLERSTGVDADLDAITGRLQAGFYELEEVGRTARDYSAAVASDPGRLREVEERLELIGQLKRKYGATIDEINLFAADCRRRLEMFQDAGEARPRLESELKRLEKEMGEIAGRMSRERGEAAKRLAEATIDHLADLAMPACGFEVRLSPDVARPYGRESGADRVEFFISPNPGMPATALGKTASGGELSRIMLAIKCAVSGEALRTDTTMAMNGQREATSLVFDEIDAGIGGETGLAVGAKLKKLATASQVICITHLAQIACYTDEHFLVIKESSPEGTVTEVERLSERGITQELCRMMGSQPDDPAARSHAESLLERARDGQE